MFSGSVKFSDDSEWWLRREWAISTVREVTVDYARTLHFCFQRVLCCQHVVRLHSTHVGQNVNFICACKKGTAFPPSLLSQNPQTLGTATGRIVTQNPNRGTEVESTDVRNSFTPLSVTFTSPIYTKLKVFLQIYKDVCDTEIYANCTRNVVDTSKNSGILWSWIFTVPVFLFSLQTFIQRTVVNICNTERYPNRTKNVQNVEKVHLHLHVKYGFSLRRFSWSSRLLIGIADRIFDTENNGVTWWGLKPATRALSVTTAGSERGRRIVTACTSRLRASR